MEINKCECGKIIPFGKYPPYCAECRAELDSWFDELFDGMTEDFEDAK